MKKMKIGDQGFFYHSVTEKKIVGIVEVIKEYEPDPTDKTERFGMVTVKALKTLNKGVSLKDIKENKKLKSGKKAEKSLAAEELKSSEFKIEKHNGQIKLYENASLEMLRRYADKALKEVEFSFSVFISKDEEKVSYIVTADKNKDLSAKSIIKEVNECLAGSGGGRDDFAQGGSQEVDDIDNKFDQLVDNLKS